MKVDDSWHHFMVDLGVLFWQEGVKPDIDDDLIDGDYYADLASLLKISNVEISHIEMDSSSRLSLRFSNNASLLVRCEADEPTMSIVEMTPGRE